MKHLKKLVLCLAIFSNQTTLSMNKHTQQTVLGNRNQYNGTSEYDEDQNSRKSLPVSPHTPKDSSNRDCLQKCSEATERLHRECKPEDSCSCISNCIQNCIQKASQAVSKYRNTQEEEKQLDFHYKPLDDDGSF